MSRRIESDDQQEFHCCFKIPREAYQELRIISAKSTIGMKELYRRAVIEYAKKQTQHLSAAQG